MQKVLVRLLNGENDCVTAAKLEQDIAKLLDDGKYRLARQDSKRVGKGRLVTVVLEDKDALAKDWLARMDAARSAREGRTAPPGPPGPSRLARQEGG